MFGGNPFAVQGYGASAAESGAGGSGTVGLAAENDLALAPGRAMAAGMTVLPVAALAPVAVQLRVAELASHTGTALAREPTVGPGLASENTAALMRTALSIRSGGLASEGAIALAPGGGMLSGSTGSALETGSALALGAVSGLSAGLAVESGSAVQLAGVSVRGAGLASEASIAVALSAAQAASWLAAEIDEAFALRLPLRSTRRPNRLALPRRNAAIAAPRPAAFAGARRANVSRGTR